MCHVLIIEDDWLIADHMAQLVEAAGAISIDFADSEDDAVARARLHHPEVIISDVNLRIGTGPDAVRRIIAELGRVPVVLVTGEPRALRPQQDDMLVLEKPVTDATLVSTFRAIAPVLRP